MKKLLIAFVLGLVCLHAQAADPQWLTDAAQAKLYAAKYNRPVLIDFTGSDWCGYCIKLDKEVFSTQEFMDYAKKNLVLLKLDFPHKKELPEAMKKANERLQSAYRVEGFPTVILTDKNGIELGRTVGYGGGSPQEFIAKIESLKKRQEAPAQNSGS